MVRKKFDLSVFVKERWKEITYTSFYFWERILANEIPHFITLTNSPSLTNHLCLYITEFIWQGAVIK